MWDVMAIQLSRSGLLVSNTPEELVDPNDTLKTSERRSDQLMPMVGWWRRTHGVLKEAFS